MSAQGRRRRRGVVLCILTVLLSSGAFGAVYFTESVRADAAADCGSGELCVRWTTPPTTKPPPIAPSRSAATSSTSTVPAISAPTTCADVAAGIVWPAGWRVLCAGPRPGLLGATEPGGVTTLFVRAGETMAWLRVVALHEAGHAWNRARLDGARIAQWCAARGCDAARFFSGGPSALEPGGAEDWAASWDACHGGAYHRSYLGFAAPDPSQCAVQNRLVGYRG